MVPVSLRVAVLLAIAAYPSAAQPAKPQPKAGVTAGGVFVGRSGKPMAHTRLILAEVAADQDILYAKVKLPVNLPTTVTDDKGQFQFTNLTPGRYAVLYQVGSTSKVLPAEISIKALSALANSPVPLLRDVQLGDTGPPNPERVWGRTFTLLKGHTFWAEGANMKIWNATARWGAQGPYMEVRKGVIVQEQFADKSQLKLIAWSY
jgi:hypothetical protein